MEETITKVLYKPVGMLVSLLGGVLAGAIFKQVWKIAFSEDDAPKATDADRSWQEFSAAEDVALLIPCGDSVDAVAEAAGAFFKAGFTDLALVQIGGTEPEQDRFLAAAPELITALKETAG